MNGWNFFIKNQLLTCSSCTMLERNNKLDICLFHINQKISLGPNKPRPN